MRGRAALRERVLEAVRAPSALELSSARITSSAPTARAASAAPSSTRWGSSRSSSASFALSGSLSQPLATTIARPRAARDRVHLRAPSGRRRRRGRAGPTRSTASISARRVERARRGQRAVHLEVAVERRHRAVGAAAQQARERDIGASIALTGAASPGACRSQRRSRRRSASATASVSACPSAEADAGADLGAVEGGDRAAVERRARTAVPIETVLEVICTPPPADRVAVDAHVRACRASAFATVSAMSTSTSPLARLAAASTVPLTRAVNADDASPVGVRRAVERAVPSSRSTRCKVARRRARARPPSPCRAGRRAARATNAAGSAIDATSALAAQAAPLRPAEADPRPHGDDHGERRRWR